MAVSVGGGGIVLLGIDFFLILQDEGWPKDKTERERTTVARTTPLSVHRSMEARFGFPNTAPSWMIHISVLIGPLVV